MSEIKTVTHEGQVYQIGKPYVFYDVLPGMLYIDKLIAVDKFSMLPFEGSYASYKHVNESKFESMGTITPAPIELIDGAVYTFGYGNRLDAVGVYDKCEKRFYHLRGMYFGFEGCTNIRLMTVESK
jgi:hypothetical protein